MKTKDLILLKAMELFSVEGFNAVTVRAIAEQVGVNNSALYKHFKSKQEILDQIIKNEEIRYRTKATETLSEINKSTNLEDICLRMFEFQTNDEQMVMFRRILIIEQFKNPEYATIYQRFYIDEPIKTQSTLFESLIKQGVMKDGDPTVMAMELYAPFFLYHTVQDKPENLMELFRIHVRNFTAMYMNEQV